MKRILLILVQLFILYSPVYAQNWIVLGADSVPLNASWVINSIAVDDSGNVYAAGGFTDVHNNYYVAKWNGIFWSELGTGNTSLNANGGISSIVIDKNGNLYAAGSFTDTAGNIYVAKWNGKSWSELGSGFNIKSVYGYKFISSITTDISGNVYAAGSLTDSSGNFYVAKWDGSNWTELGAGIDSLKANNFISSIVADKSGNVYAGGYFTDVNGNVYVAKWNGTNWIELGSSTNSLNASSTERIYTLAADDVGNIYAGGGFTDSSGNYYLAKWNGTLWSEVGTGNNSLKANGPISSVAFDTSGNIYVGGYYYAPPPAGYPIIYNVTKWDGTSWTELGLDLGTGYPSSPIQSIAVSKSNRVYVAGEFYYNGFIQVQEWNPTPPPPVTGVEYCLNQAAQPLTATGTLLKWYRYVTEVNPLPSAPIPSTAVSGNTIYYVTQTIDGFESPKTTVTVVVYPFPFSDSVSITAGSNIPVCQGVPITLTTAQASSYTWLNGSKVVGTSQTFIASPGLGYKVVVTNKEGCSDTSDVFLVSVAATNCYDCANVLNGKAKIDSCGICSGGTTELMPCNVNTAIINSVNSGRINVYPQPFENSTTIEWNSTGYLQTISVYSSTGALVFSKENINTNEIEIGENLVPGLFSVILQGDSGTYVTKIVKIK